MPLTISEQFYSIQGEGRWAGTPAVFLRLTGCNLTCSGWSYDINHGAGSGQTDNPDGTFDLKVWGNKVEHLGCDSKHVWSRGEKMSNAEVIAKWEGERWIKNLVRGVGRCHLVITGGEPLLQQDGVVSLLDDLKASDLFDIWNGGDTPVATLADLYVEVETNGTIIPTRRMEDWTNQFNVSLKPSSAGDPIEKRIRPETIEWYLDKSGSRWPLLHTTTWKFVIARQGDCTEIQTMIDKFGIPYEDVCIMPEGGTRERIAETAPLAVDFAKAYGFRYSPRLQVDIWNEVTGV